MNRMPRVSRRSGTPQCEPGYTLLELMMTLVVLSVVVITLAGVIHSASRSKTAISNNIEANQGARIAADLIMRDLRNAGFGADLDYTTSPQRGFAYIDADEVIISANLTPYPDTAAVRGWPLAYLPTGSPKPYYLNGTSWTPPIRYRTGAELIVWTLDANNDGTVSAADRDHSDGLDAKRTRNPNDYVLLRRVYGDSTNATAGNNGGTTEKVALVLAPGGSVSNLFTVYLTSSPGVAWNWASGAIPVASLPNIARIRVNTTASSARPNVRGVYPQTRYTTDVYVKRNP
jgi:prepilin-type N-terminal cleavage/methylation domain-containing protein